MAEGREATPPPPPGSWRPWNSRLLTPDLTDNVFSIQFREPGPGAWVLVPVFYLCDQVMLPLWASVSLSQKWLSLPDPPPRGLESLR